MIVSSVSLTLEVSNNAGIRKQSPICVISFDFRKINIVLILCHTNDDAGFEELTRELRGMFDYKHPN